jgi:hypothetical protein
MLQISRLFPRKNRDRERFAKGRWRSERDSNCQYGYSRATTSSPISHWQPGHPVGSNLISALILPKTGIIPKTRRDFRHSGPRKRQIGYSETLLMEQKARQRRAFSRHCRENLQSPHWLAGAGGLEPPNGGIKIRCLTTWLRPNSHGEKGRGGPRRSRRARP